MGRLEEVRDMSVCNWRYSPLREWWPPNTVQPSLPLRGWGLARMAQFHCPYYRPPLVDEAPPTEVGAVAGGGCAARELLGGTQPREPAIWMIFPLWVALRRRTFAPPGLYRSQGRHRTLLVGSQWRPWYEVTTDVQFFGCP